MDPKDIAEEHRKYLDLKDNPARVSTSAIFKLVSDGQINVAQRLSVLETKQDVHLAKLCTLDKRVEKVTDELDDEQRKLRAEFEAASTISAKTNGKFEERFTWQDKMQKLILGLIISILGYLFAVNGIPIPFP